MEFWYSERHTKDIQLSIRVEKQLYSGKSEYQQIDVFESPELGRFLVLDGFLMLTEKDEFIYHEMISHVAMAVHPNIKNVLVIGGGDGGVVRELVKYKSIEHIDLVEIDGQVIEVCKEFFPAITASFKDSRVQIHNKDGLRFVRGCQNCYDLIIVDSTDPFGPGEGLFTLEFYGNCYKALKEDGIMVNQHESPFYSEDALACQKAHKNIYATFPICKVYQAHIPTYPSGHWLFGFASKKYHPLRNLQAAEWAKQGIQCKYYTTTLHKGAFYVPAYVEELLKDVE